MADLGGQFNAGEVEPIGDRTPIPAGDYRCVIIKSEWKATSAGTGRYLEFTFQVVEGEHNKRMVWSRLNLDNPSQQAVEIARRELSAICRATGVMTPRDTSELHDIPIVLKVAVKRREDNGEPSNEVKGYESVRKASEAKQTAVAATGGTDKPAWM